MHAYLRIILTTLVLFGASCAGTVDSEPDDDVEAAWVELYAATPAPSALGSRRGQPAYIASRQADVLLDGVDFDATLEVATRAAAKGGTTALMVLWAVRDQAIDPVNAARAGALYLANIDALYSAPRTRGFDWNFGVWHTSWAISNLYRNGSPAVKAALQEAYDDAVTRPATLERFNAAAESHVNGRTMLMGDIHAGGRSLAHSTLVVPGNPDYLQSAADYR